MEQQRAFSGALRWPSQVDSSVWQAAVAGMGYASCTVTWEFVVNTWDDAMPLLTGVTASDATGRLLWDVWPVLEGTVFQDTWRLAALHRTPTYIEARLGTETGSSRMLEARTQPMDDGLLLLLRDGTAPRQVAGGPAQVRLRGVLASDPDAIFLLSRDLRVLDANRAAQGLAHCSRVSLTGRRVDRVLPGFETSLITGHARTPETDPPVIRLRGPDGTQQDLAVFAAGQGEGEEFHYVLRLRDVTRQRRIEEHLWQANERFRALVEAAEDLIFVADPELRFVFVNSRALDEFGLRQQDVVGRTVGEVFGEAFERAVQVQFQNLVDRGRSVEYETQLNVGGRDIWQHTILVPIHDLSGTIVAAAGISRDVTDTRRLHEQAVEAERLKTAQQMAGAVSHEFAQPLQALRLITEGILRSAYPEQARDLTRIIERLDYLVSRLKRLSRVKTKPYGSKSIIDLEGSAEPQVRRVLVVDDEDMLRDLLRAVIQQYGFEVDVAANGLEGLRMLENQRYGLVICDISMPVMGGVELFRRCRAGAPDLPFILMSGFTISEDDQQAIEQANGFLSKPFGVEVVRQVLVSVFGEVAASCSGAQG